MVSKLLIVQGNMCTFERILQASDKVFFSLGYVIIFKNFNTVKKANLITVKITLILIIHIICVSHNVVASISLKRHTRLKKEISR